MGFSRQNRQRRKISRRQWRTSSSCSRGGVANPRYRVSQCSGNIPRGLTGYSPQIYLLCQPVSQDRPRLMWPRQPIPFLPIPKIFGFISPLTRPIGLLPIIPFPISCRRSVLASQNLGSAHIIARCKGPEICLFQPSTTLLYLAQKGLDDLCIQSTELLAYALAPRRCL